MKRTLILAVALLFVAGPVAIAAEPTLQELKDKVQAADPKEQPKLYVKIAEMEMHAVEEQYKAGNTGQEQNILGDLASDCEKAAASAKSTRKHMKKTEIALRNIEHRLAAIGQNVSFEDRAPIKEANDRIETARSSLVDAMFAK